MNLEKIYEEVFTLEKGQIEQLKETLTKDYQRAQNTFMEESEKDQEFLQMFSFICMLSYDIYIRKQIIEKMLDEFAEKKNEKQWKKLLTVSAKLCYKRRVAIAKGYSSVGRTLVSKTKCRGFESFCPC